MGAAFGELISINWIQVTVGAIVSIVLAQGISRAYPNVQSFKTGSAKLRSGFIVILVAIVALSLIVGLYLVSGASRFFT